MAALTPLMQLACALPVPAPYAPQSIPQSFSAALADANFQRTDSYIFGSAATPKHGKQVVVPDLATLAKYFRPYKSGTGTFIINSETQRYQQFNATNHAITPSGIDLVANLPTMPWPVVNKVLVQPPNGSNQLQFSDVSGINLGQLAATGHYGSLLFVVGIDTGTNTVTFWNANAATGAAPVINDNTAFGATQDVDFLPVYVATISAASNQAATTLSCVPTAAGGTAPWPFPPQIVAGMQVTAYGASANGQPIIESVNPSTGVITMVNATRVAYGVGTRLLCMPPINAGQFWSNANYWAGVLQKSVAMEFVAILPSARGCWPACWLYGAGTVARPVTTGSEIDVMEMYNAKISPRLLGVLTQTTHASNGSTTAHTFKTSLGNWVQSAYWQPPYNVVDGQPHKFQVIWSGRDVYYFVDDVIVCADISADAWAGQPGVIGCNLALGSVSGTLLQGGLYPPNTPVAGVVDKFTVQEINVWVL